jgi:hypothetical protein
VKLGSVLERRQIGTGDDLYNGLGLADWMPASWSEHHPKIDLQKVLRRACYFLVLVRERQDVFDQDTFRERLKDNPHVDSLAKDTRLPDAAQLEADLEFVQVKSNPLVKRLVTWRDKFYAHRDPKHALDPTAFDPLLVSDVETLVNDHHRAVAPEGCGDGHLGHRKSRNLLLAVTCEWCGREGESGRCTPTRPHTPRGCAGVRLA